MRSPSSECTALSANQLSSARGVPLDLCLFIKPCWKQNQTQELTFSSQKQHVISNLSLLSPD